MNNLPVVLFAVAAVGGITMAIMKFSEKIIPIPLAVGHGIIGMCGLISLIINIQGSTGNTLLFVSLIMFIAVAAGGIAIFSLHLRKKPLPDALIGLHGIGAIISFVVLLIAVNG